MATMTESGTDKRVDDLRSEMHAGFQQTDKRLDDLRSEMDRGFDRVETDVRQVRSDMKAGFDSLDRLMIRFFAGTLGSIVAGVALLFFSHH
jgi:hypothetical protein